jgi:DNA-binding transcriptional ArsR family regulator
VSDVILTPRLRQQLDELVSSMCKALNDPKRLMLLYALREQPQSVSDLCRVVGTAQSNTSQHLAVLRDRGLVSTERRGTTILYSLRHPRILEAVDTLREVMADETDRQQRLQRSEVEATEFEGSRS